MNSRHIDTLKNTLTIAEVGFLQRINIHYVLRELWCKGISYRLIRQHIYAEITEDIV